MRTQLADEPDFQAALQNLTETGELEAVRKASLNLKKGKYASEFQRFSRQLKTDEQWEEVKNLFLMDKDELQALVDEREAGKEAFDEKMRKGDFNHGFNLFYTETSTHQMRLHAYVSDLKKYESEADFKGLKDHVFGLFEEIDRPKVERTLAAQLHDADACAHYGEGKSLLDLPDTLTIEELADAFERSNKKAEPVKEDL